MEDQTISLEIFVKIKIMEIVLKSVSVINDLGKQVLRSQIWDYALREISESNLPVLVTNSSWLIAEVFRALDKDSQEKEEFLENIEHVCKHSFCCKQI